MNKRLMFSAALMMVLLSSNAQKRAFTIEDLYKVKGVSSVSLSPDGKTVCYTASSSDLKNQKSGSDIYIMNADGSHAKALTRMGKAVLPCGARTERVSSSLIMRKGQLRFIA
jgi:Tol biopolymer transport system component